MPLSINIFCFNVFHILDLGGSLITEDTEDLEGVERLFTALCFLFIFCAFCDSHSKSSSLAIGALSPTLAPNLIILVYPPDLVAKPGPISAINFKNA